MVTIRLPDKKYTVFSLIALFFIFNPKLSDLTNLAGYGYSSRMWLDGEVVYYILYAVFGCILGRVDIKGNFIWRHIYINLYSLVYSNMLSYFYVIGGFRIIYRLFL